MSALSLYIFRSIYFWIYGPLTSVHCTWLQPLLLPSHISLRAIETHCLFNLFLVSWLPQCAATWSTSHGNYLFWRPCVVRAELWSAQKCGMKTSKPTCHELYLFYCLLFCVLLFSGNVQGKNKKKLPHNCCDVFRHCDVKSVPLFRRHAILRQRWRESLKNPSL